MPVSQPPISEDDVQSSWQLELTLLINELEQQILNLRARVEALENP